MDGFLDWLKTLDWSNVCAAIWTLVSVYGISIATLVIGILKLKTKNANFLEKLEKVQLELDARYTEKLASLKNELSLGLEVIKEGIIAANTNLNNEKIEAINTAIEEAKESVETLDPIKEINIDNLFGELK